jgi:hypothetical protein
MLLQLPERATRDDAPAQPCNDFRKTNGTLELWFSHAWAGTSSTIFIIAGPLQLGRQHQVPAMEVKFRIDIRRCLCARGGVHAIISLSLRGSTNWLTLCMLSFWQ